MFFCAILFSQLTENPVADEKHANILASWKIGTIFFIIHHLRLPSKWNIEIFNECVQPGYQRLEV